MQRGAPTYSIDGISLLGIKDGDDIDDKREVFIISCRKREKM